MIEIRTLEGVGFDKLAGVFNKAFSDYVVPVNLDAAGLQTMLSSRSWDAALADGLFVDGELQGFSHNALRTADGETILYVAGFGIAPEYRRQGFADALLDSLKGKMQQAGASAIQLEVITTNERACRLYTRHGFKTVRELLCMSCEKERLAIPVKGYSAKKAALDEVCGGALRTMQDYRPSWQNELLSARLGGAAIELLVVKIDEKIRGYSIYNRNSGSVLQMAVAKNFRRQGIAAALLAETAGCCRGRALSFINIDAVHGKEFAGYLSRRGFAETVRQYEMEFKQKTRQTICRSNYVFT